jgi:hypothetical protein
MRGVYFVLGLIVLLPGIIHSQGCQDTTLSAPRFQYKVQHPMVEVGWYAEWLDHTGGKQVLPGSLTGLEKLNHPYMKPLYPNSMHEGARSTDVSNLRGPLPYNAKAEYFHVLQKGPGFSGMCPAFDFVDDSTMVTLSFGREKTTLLLLRVGDTLTLLDELEVPGRGNSVWDLIGKKGREKLFHNTAGGAYSYLSGHDHIYIPGTNSNILRIKIENDTFNRSHIESFNIRNQIASGNLVDKKLHEKDKMNLLTALMPDISGNIWFTSRHGIVGLLHRSEVTESGCMKVYATYIGFVAALEKINEHFKTDFSGIEDIEKLRDVQKFTPEFSKEFQKIFMTSEDTREEIQNSFSVGSDGVYIVTNYALYKLRFNEEKKEIELDPKWVHAYTQGGLIYDNDHKVKPGQLNKGSGTTPTLMDERFVIICDNDSNRVNICVFSQETGDLVFKCKLFTNAGASVENSVVAYDNSIIVGNTYGYMDPFKVNPTPGGIMRFDYNEEKKTFEPVKNWPVCGTYDCKTATPKLSTPVGMLYVYNRSDQPVDGYYDWQVTGIDFNTGLRVFYIKPYFNKGEFDDNTNFLLKWGSLGSKNYDHKVFNNIWGTFTFGPSNSFLIGTYRGFLRITSD